MIADFGIFWRNDLGMCDCGQPGSIADMIATVLRLMPLHDSTNQDALRDLILLSGVRQAFLHMMSNAGLIEYGGTVEGAWITPLGNEYLRIWATAMTVSGGDIEVAFEGLHDRSF